MSDDAQSKAPLLLSFSCPVKWESMEGDENSRNCDRCACKVQNIDAYTKAEIEELLVKIDCGERICVSFALPKTLASVKAPTESIQNWLGPSYGHPAVPTNGHSSLFSPGLTKFSIALAASISLAYFNPGEQLAAHAQRGPQADSKMLPPATDRGRSANQAKSTPARKLIDKIELTPAEQNQMIAGMPAPNKIRDMAGSIIYFRGGIANIMTFPQLVAFARDVELGQISVHKLKDLADAYTMFGPAAQARRCYSLLLELADREQADPVTVESWRKEIRDLGTKEFADEISKFDERLAQEKYDETMVHLTSANNVRKLDPALAKSLSWNEIAKRLDLLESKHGPDRQGYYAEAFGLFRDEQGTPELQRWIQSQREGALRRFTHILTMSDTAMAEKRYSDALDFLSRGVDVGFVDPEVKMRCDWTSLDKKLRALAPHLNSQSRDYCSDMIRRVAHRNERPVEPTEKQSR